MHCIVFFLSPLTAGVSHEFRVVTCGKVGSPYIKSMHNEKVFKQELNAGNIVQIPCVAVIVINCIHT